MVVDGAIVGHWTDRAGHAIAPGCVAFQRHICKYNKAMFNRAFVIAIQGVYLNVRYCWDLNKISCLRFEPYLSNV